MPLPIALTQRMRAGGGIPPVSLLELQTTSGQRIFWSDKAILAPSVLSTFDDWTVPGLLFPPGASSPLPYAQFLPWINTPPTFKRYKSIQTTTGSVEIQNLSGNTVQRDAAQVLARMELTDALALYRLWFTGGEISGYTFQGTVDSVSIQADGKSMTLSLEGMCDWSKIDAPAKDIGVSCPLSFGSVACGAPSTATPCDNSYGTCSSRNRFAGIILEWTGSALDYSQTVQPAPLRLVNGRIQA